MRADTGDVEQALIVRRWRRYGADRLYVTADTGAPLGSVDLTTGQVASAGPDGAALGSAVLDGAGLEEVVRGAAQAYLRADLPELVVPASAVLPPPPAPPAAPQRPHGRRAAEEPPGAPAAPSPAVPAVPPGSPAPSAVPAGGRHRAADLVQPHAAGDEQALPEPLADRLDRLVLAGWHVLPDVPVGRQGSVVPYVLVGPAGAFAVAERLPAAPAEQLVLDGRHLSADGHGVPDLRDIRLTAARAGSLLRAAVGSPVGVRGVLVVHGTVAVRSPAAVDALVVGHDAVPGVLEGLPARWSRGRVDAVAAVARRRTTWALTWA